ncbi:probable serine/threonine-protein kinase At1g54610 [Phragmites australis]|uniref:probable serine/threonine-protein kinase At1g54610 n=1 Tax=Phragmites australis TaxID=29695 RepID=UPI002D770C75|nr:probable serine/threonine-protein kinase At1g54610 [Phragmites australis]XP_062195638.1 probable serine/threonine-protein kinase At1g54610 [Phragmites australis]
MGCVCGRPSAIEDGRCRTMPPPAAKLSAAAGVAAVRREEEARKHRQLHARAGSGREEVLERRRAMMAMTAACQVRSPVPRAVEGEQVAAGWPPWLVDVAPEAVRGWVPRRAESFEKLDKIGQGTYSNVYRARDLEKEKIVALKKVRFDNLEPESVKFMAREILILRRLDHPNVIKLEGLVTSRMSCSLYLVFEYMEHDLAGLASFPGVKFTESQVKCYMQQLLRGLEHCHSRHILHRDIKGSNLLIDNRGILKIADFGLASFFDPEQRHPLTSRVVTLWYRPPELLLGATNYGVAVDLWSTGCILAELYAGKPIMPGRTEVEQLHKIFKLCGSPSEDYWRKSKLPHATIFKPQHPYARRVSETFKDFPTPALALVDVLLSVDPADRGTASSALQSEFFTTKPYACNSSSLPRYPPSKEFDAKRREEARRQGIAGEKQHKYDPERRPRESRAVPAPDANAELVSSLQKRQAQANTRSRSEMFNPSKEDSASGFRIEPPRPTPVMESSEDSQCVYSTRTFHSGPLVNQNHPSKAGRGKNGELQVPGVANLPVAVSTRSSHCSDDSNRIMVTQAEVFAHGRRLSESINEHFSNSGKYDQAFQKKDESNGRVDGAIGYGSKGNKIHHSGPLICPSGNVDEMLKENDRQIQEVFRRTRVEKSRMRRDHGHAGNGHHPRDFGAIPVFPSSRSSYQAVQQ